jgi:hypothetical protein
MIVNVRTGQWSEVLLKLSGEHPQQASELQINRLFENYRDEIEPLLIRIMHRLEHRQPLVISSDDALRTAMQDLAKEYPFVELLYTLDGQGIQRSSNIQVDRQLAIYRGQDRSNRPYYQKARISSAGIICTAPYVSTATEHYCISAAMRLQDSTGNSSYIILDVNFEAMIDHLNQQYRHRGYIKLMRRLAPALGLLLFLLG